jgi:S1-C subfamily serine protease
VEEVSVPSTDMAGMLQAQLTEFIAAQFAPDATPAEIRDAILADPRLASLDRADLAAALEAVLGGRAPAAAAPPFRPRLLVDWGELPQIGRSARPLFSLIGPGTAGRPTVKITVDRGLDTDPADPLRQVRTEETGLWTFYVPFSLTTNGFDARAGLYVVDVDVTFPHADDGHPRFLRTQIRLNVPDGSGDQRELVIDGDGQSVVNLAGHDLRSFSRVVLKGDDRSIINLQNFSQQMAMPEVPKAPVVFEYELKVNRDIESRLPVVVAVPRPTKADAVTLAIDGRRIHVIARKRVTFGRSRDNDVCLRFLPRSSEHDEGSRAISRTHMAIDLTDDGIVLTDESTKGFDVDCDPVKGDKTFTHRDAHGSRHIDLPSPLSAEHVLEMDLTIFGHDPDDADFRADLGWDDVCFEVAGEPASRLWQVARGSGIEAARVRRLNNLTDEEYVFLYRHATVGKSAKDHAVAIPSLGPTAADVRLIHAGRMFWLHSGGRLPLALDGRRVEGACLVPLAWGQSFEIGGTTIRVGKFAQLELDDEGVPASQAADVAPARRPAPPPAASLGEVPTAGRVMIGAPADPSRAVPPPPPIAPMRAAVPPPPPPSPAPPPPPPVRPVAAGADSMLSSADPVRRALASVAVITGDDGHGSGFLAAPGVLVTNHHVVAGSVIERLTASFPDNRAVRDRSFSVSLIHEDPLNDLAYLRIEADVPSLVPKAGFRHRNGHRIVAIGSPGLGFGDEKLENLTTDGRLGPEYPGTAGGATFWALSMAVNPGNSGGPVVDAETGEVVAVVVAKFTQTDGHALAVPFEAFAHGLDLASAATPAEAARAGSLHRRRYCVDAISGVVSRAGRAIHDLVSRLGELSAGGADAMHETVNSFTDGFGRDLADHVRAMKPNIMGELTRLRDDGHCPAETTVRLERAWGGTERLSRQLSSEVGRLEIDVFADDIRAALDRATGLLDALRSELA